MPESHEIAIRVRYAETDRMGLLHHANYLVYFEIGRTELLRSRGVSYRDVEDSGFFLVLVDLGCKYKRPARYDDLLILRTSVERVTHVKIVHRYELRRDGEPCFAEGTRRMIGPPDHPPRSLLQAPSTSSPKNASASLTTAV